MYSVYMIEISVHFLVSHMIFVIGKCILLTFDDVHRGFCKKKKSLTKIKIILVN